MPANTTHPCYDRISPMWGKLRDVVQGQEAVKARSSAYLPRLSDQDPEDYAAYLKRALFFSASGRTVDGLQGSIHRKAPKLEWPKSEQERLKSLGRGGESLEQMLTVTTREVLTTGRVGLLVDAPPEGSAPDVEKSYVSTYFAEDIINWRQEVVQGKRVVTLVVLAEQHQQIDPKDPFKIEMIPQWRVLLLGTGGAFGVDGKPLPGFDEKDMSTPFYYQELWRKETAAQSPDKMVMISRTTPRKTGGRLFTEIPFAFANPSDGDPEPHEPPLNDLANVNLSHYCTSADLEHGRHFTALPTPWFAGFDFDGKLKIGSGVAYCSKDPQAKADMLEFTGSGLGHLATAMTEKERQMAVLGSRLLEAQKSGVETAEAMRLRGAGEQSALTLISKSLSAAWTKVLRWVYGWERVADAALEKISISLNTDFGVAGMDGPTLTAMMAAAQGGLMSFETFFYNLQRAEVIPDGVSCEDERERIAEGLPSGMGVVLGGPGSQDPNAPPEDDEADPDEEEDPEEDAEEDPEADKPKAKGKA